MSKEREIKIPSTVFIEVQRRYKGVVYRHKEEYGELARFSFYIDVAKDLINMLNCKDAESVVNARVVEKDKDSCIYEDINGNKFMFIPYMIL